MEEEAPEERIAKIERCQAKLAAAKAGLQARQGGPPPGAVSIPSVASFDPEPGLSAQPPRRSFRFAHNRLIMIMMVALQVRTSI
ncbi:hypothetical protein TcasGA2_TC014997 [Tribolium castaneum]|uniref:Uncharacterized protein n=1 Tax=Tribolium castaneum TaxID=7070 RepID=D2A6E9_TRICA|nr:hypothetical protein TcasGA2_TC014997 [Tribolium castaneum]